MSCGQMSRGGRYYGVGHIELRADCKSWAESRVKDMRHTMFVKIVENETFTHFRHFLPQYSAPDVGF